MGLKVKKIKSSNLESYLHMLQTKIIFSKACECGVRALMYVAAQSVSGHRASLDDVAKEINASIPLTAKILKSLVEKKILQVVSDEFELTKKLNQIKISEIIDAIKGSALAGTDNTAYADPDNDNPG